MEIERGRPREEDESVVLRTGKQILSSTTSSARQSVDILLCHANNMENQRVGVDCGGRAGKSPGSSEWGNDWRRSKGVGRWEFTINFLAGGPRHPRA